MQDYQKRVIDEKAELDEKCNKLFEFIHSEQFSSLCSDSERERMIRQLNAMWAYSEVLGERIAAFTVFTA